MKKSSCTDRTSGGFPEYERILIVEYSSTLQAKRAQVTKRNLPPGKKIAFSLRWDDANPKHVRQYQAFHPYGFKANFYVCYKPKEFFRHFIQGGCALGSHTVDHPYMIFSEPNEIFRQVMDMRLAIESTFHHCVNAFVMPSGLTYGLSGTKSGPKIHHVMGDVLIRSGHIGSPEPTDLDLPSHFNIPGDQWFSSLTFSPGDSNPNPVRFQEMLNERLKQIQTNEPYFGPYITMGIHSWQSEDGFKLLEKEIYGKYGNNPEWWYCTANEYFAFRYQFLHTIVEKIGVQGNQALFRITGSSAPELGSNVFMTLESNEPVKKASAGKAPVIVTGNCISIGHDPDHALPEFIELVPNHRIGKSGLGVDIRYEKGKRLFRITLKNHSKNSLRNISLLLRLPPLFRQEGVLRDHTAELLPGEEKKFIFPSGPESADPFFASGTMRAYFQTDFLDGGKAKRVHSVFISPRKTLTSACPRDNVKIIGPLPGKTELPSNFAEEVSTIGKPLKNYDDSPVGQWHIMKHPGHGVLGVHPYVKGLKSYKEDDIISLYLLEFEAPSAGKVNIFRWRNSARIFLNGEYIPADPKKSLVPVQAKNGWNRVLFIIRGPQWNMDAAISVSSGENPLIHLPCRMPR
ncbi:MAG: polysaccharide deacetylase family protein [Lentisphaeria bacterium]|nr:polysaccharide deacetylase family protein [Lentisphaeria bacterium]